MKKGYTLHFRRRREEKTNYPKRARMLKSTKDRLVIRITNTRAICQIVRYDIKKKTETTLISTDSRELSKRYKWKYSLKNMPALYLTGMIIAQKAKEAKINNAILDTGLRTPTKGARIFAFLKGAVDGGLDIPHEDKNYPSDERITGEHIAKYKKSAIDKDFEKIKSTILKK